MRVDQARCLEIHTRLLAGDETAREDLAREVWDALIRTLRTRNRSLARTDYIDIGAADAFMGYIRNPAKYDPEKSNLLTYLVNSATGDFRNEMARDRRHRQRETAIGGIEKCSDALDRAAVARNNQLRGRRTPRRKAQ